MGQEEGAGCVVIAAFYVQGMDRAAVALMPWHRCASVPLYEPKQAFSACMGSETIRIEGLPGHSARDARCVTLCFALSTRYLLARS